MFRESRVPQFKAHCVFGGKAEQFFGLGTVWLPVKHSQVAAGGHCAAAASALDADRDGMERSWPEVFI